MADFCENHVEADGFRIRYLEAGAGETLVCLHGGGGLRLSPLHGILAENRRVVAFEIPGFGSSPENDRSPSLEALAGTLNTAVTALGIGRRSLLGNSFGAKLALWMAIGQPAQVDSVVLIAPAAIRIPSDGPPPSAAGPEAAKAMLYAHPERHPDPAPTPRDIQDKQVRLIRPLIGPPRDAAFEDRLAGLETQTLALFGTADRVTPPAAAHLYRGIMPNCHVVMVYDAAHAIDADRPEAAAEVVGDFLERREQFLVRRQSDLIFP